MILSAVLLGGDPDTATALALDVRTDDIQGSEEATLRRQGSVTRACCTEGQGDSNLAGPVHIISSSGVLPTELPIFRAMPVDTESGCFAYVRIFSFNHNNPDGFVTEFVRLIEQLPQQGLIIDVRGNAGGSVPAAEQLLQVLTPRIVEPQRAQFANTPFNLRLCRLYDKPQQRLPDSA